MYTCGPTVWTFSHVGNLRAFLFYDLVRRHVQVSGYHITHVMNLTDIDDRILDQAMHAETTIADYVKPYTAAFFEDMAALRAQPAEHYPKATDHIGDMVAMIANLLEHENAYVADGDVYFRIASFPSYGALSHLDRGGLKAGVRVAADKYDKESVSDFALWKKAQPADEKLGAAWDAPFGRGRPGWHIECSAMAEELLGEAFEIHGGGLDLDTINRLYRRLQDCAGSYTGSKSHDERVFKTRRGQNPKLAQKNLRRHVVAIRSIRAAVDGHRRDAPVAAHRNCRRAAFRKHQELVILWPGIAVVLRNIAARFREHAHETIVSPDR